MHRPRAVSTQPQSSAHDVSLALSLFSLFALSLLSLRPSRTPQLSFTLTAPCFGGGWVSCFFTCVCWEGGGEGGGGGFALLIVVLSRDCGHSEYASTWPSEEEEPALRRATGISPLRLRLMSVGEGGKSTQRTAYLPAVIPAEGCGKCGSRTAASPNGGGKMFFRLSRIAPVADINTVPSGS